MRRSERLAKLHLLLARVQENARTRRRELGLESIGPPPGEGAASQEAPSAPPRSLILPPDEALDWTSLLASDLGRGEPLASGVGEPPFGAEDPLAPYEDLARVASTPSPSPSPPPAPLPAPDLAPIDLAPIERAPIERAPIEHAPMEQAEVEPAPESELEHAVQWAAARASMEPRALLQGAASELRERRSTAPPDEPARPSPPSPPPAATEPKPTPAPVPVPVREPPPPAPQPVAASRAKAAAAPDDGDRMDRAFLDSSRPHPAADRRRHYVIATIFAAGVVVGALAYFRRDVPSNESPTATATATVPATSAVAAATIPPPSATTESSLSRVPALPTIDPRSATLSSVVAAASVSEALPPPPRIARPTEMGLLYIDTREPSEVYVQGNRVGQSGQYIQVGCGMRFVRIAKSDPPPPGDSFPRWAGEGKAVLVPCGALHRVDLR